MKTVLITDQEGSLTAAVQAGLTEIAGQVDLIVAGSDEEALAVVEKAPVDFAVIDLCRPIAEPLALALRGLTIQPLVGRLLLVGSAPFDFAWQRLEGSRVHFIESSADSSLVSSIAESAPPPPAAFEHLEVLEVVRIAACGSSDLAVHISRGDEAGTLGFEGGVLAHASTPCNEGSDAFFEMVLWRGGPMTEVPAGQRFLFPPNLATPAVELYAEAFRFREALLNGAAEPDEPRLGPARGEPGWWARLTGQRPRGVGVVVACPGDCEQDCCHRLATYLCSELGAPKPTHPRPTKGRPAFMSLHPGDGGRLALTFVPSVARNAFLFETLARSSEAVVVCGCADASAEGWLGVVPDGVPVHRAEEVEPENWGVVELLRGLVEEES